jgi:hypothetical protein
MKIDTTYVIAFRSKGRLFVEIPEDIERKASIVAGEPLELELVGENIIYHKMPGAARLHQ